MRPIIVRAAVVACAAASVPAVVLAAAIAVGELQEALHASPNLDRGAAYYLSCAACHGTDGGGTSDGRVARIAGQHRSVLVKQLVDFRHGQRWDIRMEHFSDSHHLQSAQAIADVAAYVNRLQPEAPPGMGDGELLEHGAGVYARRCQSCHGPRGQGSQRQGVPRIAAQHYEYLRRQIYDAVEGRRPNFSPEHIRLLAPLQRDDIVGVAGFLARARAPDGSKDVHEGER